MRHLSRLVCPADRTTRSKTRLGLNSLDDRIVPTATVLDLTEQNSTASTGGVYFDQYDAQPTGTGAIDSFLRIQGAAAQGELQQGYNTDARPLQFAENKSPQFTRALPLSELPTVNFGGVLYREFLLDINQKSSQPYLSLDQLRLYVGGSGDLYGYDESSKTLAGLAPIYDLDAGGDVTVKLDYRLNSGSGSGDVLMYVPSDWFSGGSHVYLFSQFGTYYPGASGFQEWAVGEGTLTEVANIAGTVFYDANEDGIRDAGEVLLPDRIVFIDTDGNEFLSDNEAWTITNENGHFEFLDVAAGIEYTLWTQRLDQETTTSVTAIPIVGQTVRVDIPVVQPMF